MLQRELESQIRDLILQHRNTVPPDPKFPDTELIRQLYPLINSRIITVLKFFKGAWHEDDQDDMLQDVFMRLLKSIHSYNPESDFLPWLDTVTRNVKIDHFKRTSQEQYYLETPVENPDDESGQNQTMDFESRVDHAAEIFRSIDVAKLLASVDERDLELLFDYYFNGHSISEMAKRRGRPESTLKFWLGKAVKRLCEMVSGNHDDPRESDSGCDNKRAMTVRETLTPVTPFEIRGTVRDGICNRTGESESIAETNEGTVTYAVR